MGKEGIGKDDRCAVKMRRIGKVIIVPKGVVMA